MLEDHENEAQGRAEVRNEGRDPERPVGGGDGAPGSTISQDTVARGSRASREIVVPALVVLGVAVWCISVMAIGVNLAESVWEWAWILAFGTAIPAAFLWQANRILGPRAKDKEKELLGALAERGNLTPVAAAMHTSLTADEAARMLDDLGRKGYLQLRVEDGIQAYALPERDRRKLSEPSPEDGVPHPLKEPLSERELEVLTLLASGRTNSEIAGDLFVAQGTVKSHTGNIYRKLGARNRAEALARARELRLLP